MSKTLGCIQISDLSKHLDEILSRFSKKSRSFLLIDIDLKTVYLPSKGFYECTDIDSLKALVRKFIEEDDITRVYIGKGVSEEWFENNIPIFIQDIRDPNRLNLLTLGRILNFIPLKKGIWSRRHKEADLILEALDLYSKI